ncbi:hypothetical protein DFR52_101728 [Hoeflea marina]|uniref:Uncharacterized protein n=1 Tax=Hoeflea marina TaxID=274592 RepID=A0A317PRD3_9HYPH|nr:hypothetical protein [Hoeflea marina]PWW04038.1 hypothetical protein DFR52_101728 [Hoeflea marina]
MSISASLEFRVAVAFLAFGWMPAVAEGQATAATAASGKTVRIVTRTSGGAEVWAEVKQKRLDGEVSDVSYIRHVKGLAEIYAPSCDATLYFNAYTTKLGVNNPEGERWLPCAQPEVTFSDFELMTATILYRDKRFSDPATWQKAFGGVVTDSTLPDQLAEAFANKEYGRVAIISTELKEQFRTAGKVEEAGFFYGIAIDAGARGAVAKLDLPISDETLETFAYFDDRPELTTEAKGWLGDYQIKDLGVSAGAQNLGKLDWKTMRSLQGGDSANVELYKVPDGAIANFDPDVFINRKPVM